MAESDELSRIRRRQRDSVPGRSKGNTSQSGNDALVSSMDGESQGDEGGWIQGLKAMWGRLLDHIEEVMKGGTSNISPRGALTTDEVMQLWGKVTWPLVFLTRLKSKGTDAASSRSFDEKDVSMLRTSIAHAIHSESSLNDELRINISLAEAYDMVLNSVVTEAIPSFQFNKAVAALATAVKNMQRDMGLYFGDSVLQEFTSLPVLVHLSVTQTDSDTLGSSTSSSESGSENRIDGAYTIGNTHFETQTAPSDLVVVALQHCCAMSSSLMHHTCHETTASLLQPTPESLQNISRGVVFSDTETGVACLAVSVLAELGAEIDESGSKLILNDTGHFFENVFNGALSPSALVATGMCSHVPWDAARDIELGYEW